MEIKEYLNNYHNISNSMKKEILKKDIFELKKEINKNITKLEMETYAIGVENDKIDVENDKLHKEYIRDRNIYIRPEEDYDAIDKLSQIHSNNKSKSTTAEDNLNCEILKLWIIVKEMKKQQFPLLMKDLTTIKNSFEKIEPELRGVMKLEKGVDFDRYNLTYSILIDFEELYKTFKLKKNYKKPQSKKIEGQLKI